MSLHQLTDEQEPTAKRETCVVCRKPAIPNMDTRDGPICRPCKGKASEVRLEIVIFGRTYVQDLMSTRLSAVASPKKAARPPVAPAAKRIV